MCQGGRSSTWARARKGSPRVVAVDRKDRFTRGSLLLTLLHSKHSLLMIRVFQNSTGVSMEDAPGRSRWAQTGFASGLFSIQEHRRPSHRLPWRQACPSRSLRCP